MKSAIFFCCQPARPPRKFGVLRAAALEPRELVDQHGSERLGVGGGAGVLHLRLELESGFPDVVVGEEQPRREFDLGELEVGVRERSLRIDVEKGAAREHARILPAVKAVVGGNEAQLAAEFALRRTLEAFHDGFAVFALGPLGCDQHVIGRLDAIFEAVETCDFDGVGPDPVPRGTPSTHDIRWGKRNAGGRILLAAERAHDVNSWSDKCSDPPASSDDFWVIACPRTDIDGPTAAESKPRWSAFHSH